MTFIAERLRMIKPSPTLMLSQMAADMKASGKDVINLTAGEPDFETPEWVCRAAINAIHRGETRYTNVTGTPALKKAVQEKFRHENGLDYEPNEIIVGVGAKHIIYNALLATLNPGDEVIIPAPYWVSYSDMVLLAEGSPVIVSCTEDEGFKLTPEKLSRAITHKTKWLILNSPSNPTGAVYSHRELLALAEVLQHHPHVHVMSDDIYEHIWYHNEPFKTLAALVPAMKDRILTVNGVSKSYAMTGWRIGYACGHHLLINAMGILQSQSTSNPCSIAQAAAVAALTGSQDFHKERCRIFKERRDMVVSSLNRIPGLSCLVPAGAFYVYPSCKNLFGKKMPNGDLIRDDGDFAAYLLEKANVAVVPGRAFGFGGHIRISYALSTPLLQQACERIKNCVEVLK